MALNRDRAVKNSFLALNQIGNSSTGGSEAAPNGAMTNFAPSAAPPFVTTASTFPYPWPGRKPDKHGSRLLTINFKHT